MKIILASDSYKGSLSSEQANSILERAAGKIFKAPDTALLSIADGGEGTLEAILGKENREGYEKIFLPVTGPGGKILETFYLKKGGKAVIEMAKASGLPLLCEEERDPRETSTYGTGELMAHALKNGCTELYIGIGGSATNDGGMGAMAALGFRFLDRNGEAMEPVGGNLIRVESIDDSKVLPELEEARITVMCDVTNPLTGEKGAARVFAPQKGADPDMVEELERGMLHYQEILQRFWERKRPGHSTPISTVPGLGAAGGLGAALYVFCGAVLRSGIDVLLDLNQFEELLLGADLVVTGEGRTDEQSADGKVISGIARRAKRAGVPVFVISGSLEGNLEPLYELGISGMESCVCKITSLEDALAHAEENLEQAAERVFRMICASSRFLS